MRTRVVLAIQASLLFTILAAADGGPIPSGGALGIHGDGTEWGLGNPTARWRPGPSLAIDFTPSLSYYEESGRTYEYRYRFEVACVPTIRTWDRFLLGLRIAPGYGQNIRWDGAQKFKTYSVDLSVGADIEYFLPVIPTLSVGIQSVVRVRYAELAYIWEGSPRWYNRQIRVDFLGQWLTLRYYF